MGRQIRKKRALNYRVELVEERFLPHTKVRHMDIRYGLLKQDPSKLFVGIYNRGVDAEFTSVIVPLSAEVTKDWETGKATILNNARNMDPKTFNQTYNKSFPGQFLDRKSRIARIYMLACGQCSCGCNEDTVEIPKDEFEKEHKHLLRVLKSPSRKDDKEEYESQKKELEDLI